jgi:hypothetical protein
MGGLNRLELRNKLLFPSWIPVGVEFERCEL